MARRKITEAAEELDASALPDITPRDMEMVILLAEGLTQTDAYLQAYKATGYSRPALYVAASKKCGQPAIVEWLDALKSAGAHKAVLSRDAHLLRLSQLAHRAEKAGNYGAAVQAEQLRGKVIGLYVEQVRDVTEAMPDEELLRQVYSKFGPEAAQKQAKALGLDWTTFGPRLTGLEAPAEGTA